VLEEAQDSLTPTMEKLKFVSIFSSNLDEYFMVRVGGLLRVLRANIGGIGPSGRTVRQQLDEIAEKVRALVTEQYAYINDEILPRLKGVRAFLHRLDELDKKERKRLEEYFEAQVFPILTPLAVDAGHPFPFLANLRLNLMAVFKEASGIKVPQAYAFVEVPSILPRLVPVNAEMEGHHFILLEDLIREHIQRLFPGMEIKNILAFRVTRKYD
jgi:polyphosphate kinase